MEVLIYISIYSIAIYGMSNALVYFNGPLNIIDKFRKKMSSIHQTFDELFSCMFCLPTNIGIILSLISHFLMTSEAFTPFSLLFPHVLSNSFLNVIFDGMFTGGIVYLIHTFQQLMERRGNNE